MQWQLVSRISAVKMAPTSILTEAEVSQIVKRFFNRDVEVKKFEITRKGEQRLGYLGEHLLLIVRVNEEPECRFFVKTHPTDLLEDYVGETGLFEREENMYRLLFPKLREVIPESWYPNYYFSKDSLIVLEDLSVEGFEVTTNLTLSRSEIELVLKKLSILHASSIILEEKVVSLHEIYPKLLEELVYSETKPQLALKRWFMKGIKDLQVGADLLTEYSSEEKSVIKEKLPTLLTMMYPLHRHSTKYRNVVTHGDMWKNNILFRYVDGRLDDCRLLDFQFTRLAPPAHDVMHLLYMTTTKTFRDEEMPSLIRYYYQQLGKQLGACGFDVQEVVPLDSYLESCSENRFLALLQGLMGMHAVLAPFRPTTDKTDLAEIDEFLERNRNDYMTRYFHDEKYSAIVPDLYRELINDYVLHNH